MLKRYVGNIQMVFPGHLKEVEMGASEVFHIFLNSVVSQMSRDCFKRNFMGFQDKFKHDS